MNVIKKLFLLLITTALLTSCNTVKYDGTFSYEPENPKPGDEILIKYNPVDTKLAKAEKISLDAYQFNSDIELASYVQMEKNGIGWTGRVQTSTDANGVMIKFYDDSNSDENNKKGYTILFHRNVDNATPGAKAGLAVAYFTWAKSLFSTEVENDEIKELFETDLNENHEIKAKYLSTYFYFLSKNYPESVNDIVKNELKDLEKIENPNEDELRCLMSSYYFTNNPQKYQETNTTLVEKFPDSREAQIKDYSKFKSLNSPDEIIGEANRFFSKSHDKDVEGAVISKVASVLVANNKLDELDNILNNENSSFGPSIFNSIAWSLFKSESNLEKAKVYAKHGIDLSRKELLKPFSEREKGFTEKDFDKRRKYNLAMVLDTYVSISQKINPDENLIDYLEEAVELTDGEEIEINQNYSSALIKSKNYQKALTKLKNFIKLGNSNAEMKTMLKDSFVQVNKTEDGFDKLISELEGNANAKIQTELKSKLISEAAPEFTLTDLKGKDVSLTDYKGKVVIVDFWATWCGPCKASFPGMQKIVNKFADNENVKFLFINTFENKDGKVKRAEKFIKDNNYNFYVLMDLNSEVVSKYKVTGIPTKFIIDKKGNIRFKSVGFNGNPDELVNELSMMIDMVD